MKEDILTWLNTEILYPISDSQWVSPVHVDPKKVVVIVIVNEKCKEIDVSFSCVVKKRRWSKKIYKTEITKIRYNNQVLCKSRVNPQRAGLTLIVELTWSNLGLKGVFNKRK